MTENWHKIWNQRRIASDAGYDLQELLKVDGYDCGAGQYHVEHFREYIRVIVQRLEIGDSSSLYEVGCGAGAFLVGLRELITMQMIGGCDYSASLIEIAQRLFAKGDFTLAEAAGICTERKYDVVLAHGVFHYFPDFDYAARVLDKMIEKANRVVAILEVPNESTREQAERTRREQLTAEVYEAKYAGLRHQYYWPSWFGKIAEKHDCVWHHFEYLSGYTQSRYRSNVVIRKEAMDRSPNPL